MKQALDLKFLAASKVRGLKEHVGVILVELRAGKRDLNTVLRGDDDAFRLLFRLRLGAEDFAFFAGNACAERSRTFGPPRTGSGHIGSCVARRELVTPETKCSMEFSGPWFMNLDDKTTFQTQASQTSKVGFRGNIGSSIGVEALVKLDQTSGPRKTHRMNAEKHSNAALVASLARLWPNREHESSAVAGLFCRVSLHYWRRLDTSKLAPGRDVRFCFWCSDIEIDGVVHTP